ncbi:MAG: hypothetical protein K9H61_03410 [Bacteroidia bacterium]|nr:hypothetical protein [Bacteroidia bacterium]MCF8425686.1 hypothetical protein [Bacteroidia bacterium]MCF8446020.1 hypothetical protein [Bacteroidia bacterium]
MKNKIYSLLIVVFLSPGFLFGQATLQNLPFSPNGPVYCQKQVGSTLYIGGSFSSLDVTTGPIAGLNLNNTPSSLPFPVVNGTINTIASDGTGGYLIGGSFTTVGGQSRQNFARINANYTLHPMNIGFNGSVTKIVVNNGTAYVFGAYSYAIVNGSYTYRYRTTALNLNLSNITAWNSGLTSGVVNDALIANNKLFIGGQLRINGTYRALAAYALTTGGGSLITTFNPSITYNNSTSSANISSLAYGNNQLYFGGLFNKLNGNSKYNLGGINIVTNTNSPLYVVLNSSVTSISWFNNMLYVGGNFTTVNGSSKPRLFAYNTSVNSVLNNWSPSPNSTVKKVGVLNGYLWVSGYFSLINNTARSYFAAFNLSSNTSIPPIINPLFSPNPNNVVNDILPINSFSVVAVGAFNKISAGVRNGAMAINLINNSLTSFAPNVVGTVRSIDVSGANVFLGGSISQINGNYVQNFGVVNSSNGATNSVFKANFNSTVNSIMVIGSNLYVGGNFSTATIYNGSSTLNYLKKAICGMYISSTGLTINSSFNPNLVGNSTTPYVNVIKYISGQLFVGGSFYLPRNGLVSLNPSTGSTNSFNANLNYSYTRVNDLTLTPQNELVIAGYIPYVNNNYTYNIAYVNPISGGFLRSNYNPSSSYAVSYEPKAIVNGNLNDVMYVNSYGLIRAQNQTGLSAIAYTHSGNHYALSKFGTTYIIGGSFNYYNSNAGSYYTNLMAIDFIPPMPPTVVAKNLTFSNVTTNSMRINWVNGNGDRRIVLVRAATPVTSQPLDFTSYSASSSYGYGSNINGAYTVYNGTGQYVDLYNLQPSIMYYVKIIEYNGTGITLTYATSGLSGQQMTNGILPPTIGTTNIIASNISKNSMYLNWSPGNGNGRIVIAREGSPVNVIPSDNNNYYSSYLFGSGTHLGSGNYVISKGNTTGTWLYQLKAGVTYHFAVFEYNQFGTYVFRHKTTLFPTTSAQTLSNAPEPTVASNNLSVQNLGGGSVKVTWNKGNGSHRILLANPYQLNNITSVNTNDGSSYISNNTLTSYSPYPSSVGVTENYYSTYGHRVVYNSTGEIAYLYGLNSNTTYNFVLVEYNTQGNGTENYQQGNWTSLNFTMPPLVQAPTIPDLNLNVVATTHNSAKISWQNGNGARRILVGKAGLSVNWTPTLNTSYASNSSFGSGTSYNGHFVLYDGTLNNATVTNLQAYTDYSFAVYAYNTAYNSYTYQTEIKYQNTPSTGTGKTQPASWPRIGGGEGTDAAGGVATDPSGNVYVAGTYNGSAYFGLNQVIGSSNQIFLAKYTSAGALVWIQTAGGNGEDAASSVSVDNNGNSYVVGSFRNSANFGTTTVTSNGSDDAFIAKYNANGVLQWVRTLGGSGQDVAFWTKTFDNGDVVATGYYHGNLSFSNSTQVLSSNGNSDIWVAKYASNGNLLWSASAGGNSYDYGHCVTIGASNTVIVSGEYKTTATFGSTSLTNNGGESNGFIAKLSSAGSWQWATKVGGTGTDAAYAVTADSTDNYYLAGTFSDTASFGIDNMISEGLTDGFVSRVNSNGNIQWTRQFGGISKDLAQGISIGQNGTVFVAGSFAGSMNMNGNTLVSSGNQDIVVATYTQTGLLTNSYKFGGSLNDQSRGILALDNTTTYLCGYFEGTAVFGGFEVSAVGNSSNPLTGDMFVHNIGSVYNNNPNTDLISWFKLNGNYNDFSGNNFNGTATNSPVFVSNHLNTSNSAVSLNGNKWITYNTSNAPQFDNISEFTYTGWIKLNSYSSGNIQMLLHSQNSSSYTNLFLYALNNGKLECYLYDNNGINLCGSYTSADNTIPLNIWTHVSLTFKSNNSFKLFVNGSLVTNGTSYFANNITGFNNKGVTMGGYIYSGTNYYPFAGELDDQRLYKKALTQTEILDIMAATSANSAPPIEQKTKSLLNEEPAVLFPNPSNGIFNLSFNYEEDKVLSFRLIDFSGKTVFEEADQAFNSGKQLKIFQADKINKGYYVLQVIENNRILSNHKLIIN